MALSSTIAGILHFSGYLENVKAIFGLHVSPDHPLGQVFSRSGPVLAGSDVFEAILTKKGGHAAIPQHSIDPILAASNVVVSLQYLVSREPDPLDSQGLNYVAALLLLVMKTEEDAFWMLAVLLENVLVNDCYSNNLSG
ncbi:putative Rab-GTPase-TBC domain, bacterial exopeptidase dimerization domain-containing protein [Helianthus annuus]|nr:putative Rab-GTPase-TBC domain, bacterial exopeptidase dimerization domain-containing protein [Helianthus annuus]